MSANGKIRFRFFFWLLSFATVALFSNWAGIISNPSPARAQSANMILFTDTTPPTGWTLVSGGGAIPGDFYQKFPRGYSSYGGTSGAATHTHTVTYGSCTSESGTPIVVEGTTGGLADSGHRHNSLSSGSTGSATLLPPYRDLRVVKYSGIPSNLMPGLIAVFSTAPSAGVWSQYSSQNGKFIQGEASAGGTGGASTHTHSISITTGGPSSAISASGSSNPTVPTSTHTHSGSGDTDSVNHEPKHVDVLLYQVNAEAYPLVPDNMIAMFDAAPGAGWDVLSNDGGDFYERFLQGATSYATGQGNATHGHLGKNIITGTESATSQSNQPPKTSPSVASSASHVHIVGVTFNSVNNIPPYRDVIIAQKKPAVFKSQDWRWYDAENVADPANSNGSDSTTGDSMANENTAPTSTRIIYKGNAIKLRFKITETGGGYEDNIRFRLQFDTSNSFPIPTYVAAQGATGLTDTWRYYNGAGDDDAIISNVRLSGSPSAGTRNETGTSASTFDFAASTTYEFEFTIQLNPATPISPPNSQIYYFRAYDTVNGAAVPTDTAKTYPSLTTSAAFDLEVQTTPGNVELGSYQKGSNGTDGGTLSYTFASNEKMVFWDKTGSSNGWSLSVSCTDLSGPTDTIPNDDVRWISAAASLNGSFASDTTGISGQNGAMLDQSRTAYAADANEGKGGFFFQPTVEVTQLNNRNVESYSGTLTITLA